MRARAWVIHRIKERYDAYETPERPPRIHANGEITAERTWTVRR